MRRSINNKLSVSLIIIIAVFTILSYSFDQLVIRNEDKLRNAKINFSNIDQNITKLRSVSSQLMSSSEYANQKLVQFLRYRNYWLKHILLTNDYKSLPNLKDYQILDLYSSDFKEPNYIPNLIKRRFIDQLKDIVMSINNIEDKMYNIYGWNLSFFPQYEGEFNDEKFYNFSEVDFKVIFKKNIDLFKHKKFSKYVRIINTDEGRTKAAEEFTLNNWMDVHKYSHLLINEFSNYLDIIDKDTALIDDKIIVYEDMRQNSQIMIQKISSQKNFFILLSISTQILSLLFLLFLFRSLILNKL